MARKVASGGVTALVITGPVGAGKSTVAVATSALLEERHIAHALVDLDHLRWVFPRPENDPFATQIGYRNLAAIWPTLASMEPECVVLTDVVETRSQIEEYMSAMPGADIVVVRLNVPMDLIRARLDTRETQQTLDWYRQRAAELQLIMEREDVANFVIDVGDREPDAIAREILDALL